MNPEVSIDSPANNSVQVRLCNPREGRIITRTFFDFGDYIREIEILQEEGEVLTLESFDHESLDETGFSSLFVLAGDFAARNPEKSLTFYFDSQIE